MLPITDLVVWRCGRCGATAAVAREDFEHVTCVACESRGVSGPHDHAATTRRAPVVDCNHRQNEIARVKCLGCKGQLIKVFACEQLGRCTIGKRLDGIACCATCPPAVRERPVSPSPTLRLSPSRKTRVGFLAVVYSAMGGTETWHRTLLPALTGVEVVGFVTTWKSGGDTSLLGCPVGHGVEAARELARRVDVLVEWGVADLASILPSENRPAVISVHHGDNSSQWARQMIDERLAIADCIACVNPIVAEQLRRRGVRAEYSANPVHVGRTILSDSVATDRIVRPTRGGRPTVLWLGRFAPEKRPLLAIDIAGEMPDVDFRIAGCGGLLTRMRRAARRLKNVRMLEPVPWPAAELERADVLLSTSDQEGFGYSMAEAMLARVPVVATPCGVAANGRLCEQVAIEATPRDWAQAIRRAIADPDPAKIAFAASVIEDRHSPAKIAKQWEELIAGLIVDRSLRDRKPVESRSDSSTLEAR